MQDREIRENFRRMREWQEDHMQTHRDEAQARTSLHRWAVSGVLIPTAAVLVSALAIILAFVNMGH